MSHDYTNSGVQTLLHSLRSYIPQGSLKQALTYPSCPAAQVAPRTLLGNEPDWDEPFT